LLVPLTPGFRLKAGMTKLYMSIEKYNKKELLNISDVTIEKLKSGDLIQELPEIYELKEVIENTIGHINRSVFNHTLDVLENLEKLINKNNK